MHPPVTTVLFDLDGTLADTAPDLAFALNRLRLEQGRQELPFAAIRDHVSHGSTALVRIGFPELDPKGDAFARLRQRFLEIYNENLYLDTRLFPGIESLLAYLEKQRMRWGVVTNKPAFLTDPLMRALGLFERAACVVSGDTTDERKPHPKPLLHACELAASAPAQCLYVGDASRDIEAGRAAGMHTLVALYGYIDDTQVPQDWGADGMIDDPRQILDWLLESGLHRAAV